MNQIERQTEQARAHRRFDRQAQHSGEDVRPSLQLQAFRFVGGYGDYVVGHIFDGATEDSEDVLIALDPQLRESLVGAGYTYADFQTRTRDSNGREEQMFPRFLFSPASLIWATQTPYSGVEVSGVQLEWLMVVPSVHWMALCAPGS